MSKVKNLKKLYDASLQEGKSLSDYTNSVRSACGIKITEEGMKNDADKQILDPKGISFQEVAYEFLGPDYGRKLLERNRMQEVSGGMVTPGTFSNTNGFDATAFGLLDALILEGFNAPYFMWEDFVTVEQTRTNGGKAIRAYNDEFTGVGLAPGEEAPAVGLKEGWVTRNPNIRRAHKVQVLLESILYDHTDTIQQSAFDSGVKIANAIETHVARTVLGVDNTYVRDGTSGNTYLTAKGTGVMAYKNSEPNALATYQNVQTAMATLCGNVDPYTQIPIMVDVSKMTVVVPMAKIYDAKTILHASQIFAGSSVNADFVNRFSANPLEADYGIKASPIWDAVNVAGSKSYFSWAFGEFKKALGYRQLVPFSTISTPLGPKEVTSNVALCVYCQEIGAVYVKEPRYTYIATTQ